jgi:hypothetical protein
MYHDDSPLDTAELRDANRVLMEHLPPSGGGRCPGCGLDWPCEPYRQARAVYMAHGRPRPLYPDETMNPGKDI